MTSQGRQNKQGGKENVQNTAEQVEDEIARLLASPLVKLAKKEEAIRYRRRQYMYTLRAYEKKGRQLAAEGVTLESLEAITEE